MDEYLVKTLGPWVVIIIMMGSLVDIVQFIWIMKRTYRKTKRIIYNKIKREILENMNGEKK